MIYADHNATTPCLPEVAAAMAEALAAGWGNPSARQHLPGRRALAALDAARAEVAALIGARAEEPVFTSGATEALNLAILGVGERLLAVRPRLVAAAAEHPAVREPLLRLTRAGAELVEIPLLPDGRVDPDRLAAAIDDRTALVAVTLAHHESGVVQDLPAVAAAAHRHGALVLCDAVQAIGRLPVDGQALGCDLLAVTAHKCYGPMGVGALWVRRGLALAPQLFGGGQEDARRPGTPNLPGIHAFGVAAALARRDLAARAAHLAACTAACESRLRVGLPGLRIVGDGAVRVPGTTFCWLPGLPRGWLATISGAAVSGGAACSLGEPSPLLRALGVPEDQCRNAIRVSFGVGSLPDQAAAVAGMLVQGARALGTA